MFTRFAFRSFLPSVDSAVRFVSSKNKSNSSSLNSVLRHNWLEMTADLSPTDASQLSSNQPDPTFNQRLLRYLANATKRPLTAQVHQHLMNSFQHWSPKEFYDLINILGAYGLQPSDVIHLLTELPSADKSLVNVKKFQECFENLLQLKFDTTTRSILISNDPHLIQYDVAYLRERFDVLHCYFTLREIQKLVRTHKKLFSESWKDLDYKINYLKIMLFASTRDIVESGALAFPIDHIRQRYLFVFRTGLFKRVRREEQYVIQRQSNISLIDIFQTSVKTFLQRTTNNLLRPEDYQAFVESLKYETFDDEFQRYLTFDNTRKKWKTREMFLERQERRHWMGEFDMYNEQIEDEDEDDDDVDGKSHSLVVQSESSTLSDEKTSKWHPLSHWNPDRHRTKKLRLNIDPQIRI